MCAGALVLARIDTVVFAADDPKAGACGALYDVVRDPALNHQLTVRRGVLAEEANALLVAFFAERR
jgi:tRNA(adenine34) deaminase